MQVFPDFEADAFISEPSQGEVRVTIEGSHAGSFEDCESAERFLWQWTEGHSFYPETWFVNERGNTTLLVRTDNPNEPYTYSDVSYV
jgi:hypothetical protein